jgi:cell division protein ZapA (FtsZ GTPase activity inhibitor)
VGEARRVEVSLLGQVLTIRTEAPPEYLQTLARFVEERVETLRRAGVTDFTRALLLASLDIADELHRAREDTDRARGDVGVRLGALVSLLERATPPEPSQPPGRQAP